MTGSYVIGRGKGNEPLLIASCVGLCAVLWFGVDRKSKDGSGDEADEVWDKLSDPTGLTTQGGKGGSGGQTIGRVGPAMPALPEGASDTVRRRIQIIQSMLNTFNSGGIDEFPVMIRNLYHEVSPLVVMVATSR